jgi:hypothetical protein
MPQDPILSCLSSYSRPLPLPSTHCCQPTIAMDALPPELLRMILSPDKSRCPYQIITTVLGDEIPTHHYNNQFYPTSKEYLRFRLVSKTFCAIVTPFAFESLRIESVETSMSRLTSIANDDFLKAMVKEYEFAFSREQMPGVYSPGRVFPPSSDFSY